MVYKTDANMILKGWRVRPLEVEQSMSGEEGAGGVLSRSPGIGSVCPPLTL